MPLILDLTYSLIFFSLMLYVAESMSTNTGVAPARMIASPVAVNVKGVVING